MAKERLGVDNTVSALVESSQLAVYHFLSAEIAYNGDSRESAQNTHDKDEVENVNTHGAHLFLHEHVVYKIKRAIAYSYLDTTSLASRERLCKRELEINEPVLPDIYLDVVPITSSSDGSLSFDGNGKVVEWVLRMNRFDEHQVLDTMANEGRLSTDLAHQLGAALAAFHNQLEPAGVNDGYQRISEVVHELIHEFSVLKRPLADNLVSLFGKLALRHLGNNKTLLNKRASAGFVRRCHGDLHLRNILLQDGKPVPFDALEFDERMATTDVLYDLAFLIMDLSHQGLKEHENIVLNAYLLYSYQENTAALSLLPLFLGCRAGIRAMTTAQAAAIDQALSIQLSDEAERYLRAATEYMSGKHSTLITIGGLSGTGKSTIAAKLPTRLAPSPGAILLRSDAERKAALGMEETDMLPAEHYTVDATNANYQLLSDKAAAALAAGYCVVIDATFLDKIQQRAFENLAQTQGCRFIGFWLRAPHEILRARIVQREDDASDATLEVLESQIISSHSANDWHQIDAGCDESESLRQCLEIVVADNREHCMHHQPVDDVRYVTNASKLPSFE